MNVTHICMPYNSIVARTDILFLRIATEGGEAKSSCEVLLTFFDILQRHHRIKIHHNTYV